MIRKLLIVVGVPLLIGSFLGGAVGLIFDPMHWRYAALAFLLGVPAGTLALLSGEYLIRMHPLGRVLAVFVGAFVRMVVVGLGGLAVFLLAGPEGRIGSEEEENRRPVAVLGIGLDNRSDRVSFWLWVLFAYLTTLAVDTALFAGSFGKPVVGAQAETGGGASHGG